jgi:hypothetical protein
MKILSKLIIIIIAALSIVSCRKDENTNDGERLLNLTLIAPEGEKIRSYNELTIRLKELNTGGVITKNYINLQRLTLSIPLAAGSYEVSVEGSITYQRGNEKLTGSVSAFSEKIDLTEPSNHKSLQLMLKRTAQDLILEEIFISGTRTPEGKQYIGDSYIKLYNNTEKILYADGLLILQSFFETNAKVQHSPNIIAEAFNVDAVQQIPGSGKDYPVPPYTSIIIATDAIDHREYNKNSIDLRGANFEIKKSDDDEDLDNPQVPNLNNILGELVLSNQGNKAYAIARLPKGMTASQYLAEYKYNYTYKEIGVDFDIPQENYKIPNQWIVDAVNIAPKEEFQWLLTSEALDSGWTYSSESQGDNGRYGKAVRRKVSNSDAGKINYQDTNNSIADFIPRVQASLIK